MKNTQIQEKIEIKGKRNLLERLPEGEMSNKQSSFDLSDAIE